MFLEVDPASAVPPYEQVRAQLAGFIGTGTLPPGTRLPAIRQLAGDLGVAAGTVARAYRELENAGLIESHGRHGTRVADAPPPVDPPPTRAHLDEAAAAFATAAARGGHDMTQALDAVRRAFAQIDTAAQAELGGQT
jgi:DNA-binding transcriptional regulator YhcF (GntR family)